MFEFGAGRNDSLLELEGAAHRLCEIDVPGVYSNK